MAEEVPALFLYRAGFAVRGDHDVVEEFDAEDFSGVFEPFGEFEVGCGGFDSA